MLIFIYGDNFKKTRDCLNSLVKDFTEKTPDISSLRINEDNLNDSDITGFLAGQGLFEKQILVILDNILTSDLFTEDIKKILPAMSQSANTFIILEGLLDKKTVDLAKKEASRTESFFLEKKEIKVFNPFSLGDALGSRNKKNLWVTFYKALENGLAPEEIHGILFWQIKTILIAKDSESPQESKLKPFVYGKAKNFSKNFSTEDLQKLSKEMVDVYHNSRKGLTDLPIAIEKFILKI